MNDQSENEIDIKIIFRILYRYRYLIISSIVFFTLVSGFYAYFQPNIYSATTTLEVGVQKSGQDAIYEAMGSSDRKPGNEIAIIKSRFLAQKAIGKVNFTHHYYVTKNFKERELYKDAPFHVVLTEGHNISFDLYPVDDEHYRLVVAEGVEGWNYDEVHQYGEEIGNTYFHLTVTRNLEKLPTESQYRFVISKPEKIAQSILGSINVGILIPGSSILGISYQDTVALRAKEFVNALAEAYIEQSVEYKTREAGLTLVFIDEQLEAINKNLQQSAGELENFKTSTNTPDLGTKTAAIIGRMSEYETEISKTSIDEKMLDSLYVQIKSGHNLETLSVAGLQLSDTALSELIKNLQEAVMKKKILRQDYTEEYPEVTKLRSQIVQLKNIIAYTLKNLKKNMKERKALLQKLFDGQQKQLNTLPASEREYGKLQRRFMINEKIYSYLLEKKSEMEIVKAATVSQNRILDAALLPLTPVSPKRKMTVVIGMFFGLVFGLAFAFLREFLDDRIKEEDDISRGTDAPILGMIPYVADSGEKINVFESPKSVISESYRMLRTNLQFMLADGRSQVIAVTSTVGGEGKTTICTNLGAIVSLTGKKTIILNLDMRKPTLHKRFNLSNKEGMSNLLANRASLSDVIQHTEHEHLDIISSGPVPPNPSELIHGQHMLEILEELKNDYDVIILDTPPVGLVTDAHMLMRHADASIYVVRAHVSSKEFLRNVEKLYQEKDIHGFGVLMNGIKMSKGKYGYGYGYGYGYYAEDKK